MPPYEVHPAGPAAAQLGESPLWSVAEQCLYYVDIGARQVLRLDPASGALRHWPLDSEPGCIALLDARDGGGLLVAQRNGLWKLDTATGAHEPIAPAPFDGARQRFNDGKPDAAGRFWIGTIDDARAPAAALWRYAGGGFAAMAGGITTSNGLAWSPDGRTMYWSDTKAHEIYAFDFDAATGALGERRVFASFAPREAGQSLDSYGGRPDGAAVDVEGCYWVAMYEGRRLLRLSPEGQVLREVMLPVRCPTMPTFGGADMKTLFVTTASAGRPAEELAMEPWAGKVLRLAVDVPGQAPFAARR